MVRLGQLGQAASLWRRSALAPLAGRVSRGSPFGRVPVNSAASLRDLLCAHGPGADGRDARTFCCRRRCWSAPRPLQRAPRRPRRSCLIRRTATRTALSAGAAGLRTLRALAVVLMCLSPQRRVHARSVFHGAVSSSHAGAVAAARSQRAFVDALHATAGECSCSRAAHLEGPRSRCGSQFTAVHRFWLLRQQHHGAPCSPLSCAAVP